MSDDGLKVHPAARILGLVPVLLIAGAIIAAMLGFRPEGRAPVTVEWRSHAVAENNFAVTAPGVFIISQQPMNFGGQDVDAQTYIATDMGVDFIVLVVKRPEGDTRPAADVAKSLGLSGTNPEQRADGLTVFRHDGTMEGARTQAAVIVNQRTVYQLMVSTRAASFPAADAERFFGSFRLLGKT